MGTKFFAQTPKNITPANLNMTARSINAGSYAGARAGGAAQKDIAAAQALYKAHGGFKPQQRGAAYPKGPKT
jgi:hypothetical protein